MRLLLTCSVLLCVPAAAVAEDPKLAEAAWIKPCVERLEAARAEMARVEPRFAEVTIRAHKVNSGEDSVAFTMVSRGKGVDDFWIEITDQTGHRVDERAMHGVEGWAPIKSAKPLPYPTQVRHVHPMTARMQGNEAVTDLKWRAFLEKFQPAVEKCLGL